MEVVAWLQTEYWLWEDDGAISQLIEINLQVAGYDCTALTDGEEARRFLEEDHSFDMALLDIMLPGLDGFELLPIMQQYDIPVIYLTAKGDVASKIKGLKDGAEDYIVKPFEILELLVRIEKVLERNGRLNRIIRLKDITIDLEKRVVTRFGEEIALKPMEFELLAMLAKYKNRTMPP